MTPFAPASLGACRAFKYEHGAYARKHRQIDARVRRDGSRMGARGIYELPTAQRISATQAHAVDGDRGTHRPLRSPAPLRKRAQGVHIIVNHVRVGILLPAAEHGTLAEIARAALLVDRIQREI
jgi:hypothetical protein